MIDFGRRRCCVFVALGCISAGVVAQGAPPASAAEREAAADFWKRFRAAALSRNEARLAKLTRLPLELRGVTDDEPVQRVGRARLLQAIERVMAEESAGPDGGAALSQRRWIERKTTLLPADWLADDLIRVQQMEFERIEGRWYLVRAYTGG